MFRTITRIFSKNLSISGFKPVKSLKGMKPESLLFQTGYLTIDKIDSGWSVPKYALKCPDKEIACAIAQGSVEMDSPFQGFKGTIN
ncbi:MAG: hypothetical protein LBT40_01050 [Deltaproteobacteria bacterium]|jgi:hypothetical protein|nr:hypothetical protein [Deltaproteobacteria bacterium]